jgi:hypothetical protein
MVYNGFGGAYRVNDKVAEFGILLIFNVAVEKSEACSRFNTVRSAGEKCDFSPDFPLAEYEGVMRTSIGSIE